MNHEQAIRFLENQIESIPKPYNTVRKSLCEELVNILMIVKHDQENKQEP